MFLRHLQPLPVHNLASEDLINFDAIIRNNARRKIFNDFRKFVRSTSTSKSLPCGLSTKNILTESFG